jgi:hypothetical protein
MGFKHLSSQDKELEDFQQDISGSCNEDDSVEEEPEQDISGSCNESESCNEEPENPHCQIHRKGSKKRSFVFPKESEVQRKVYQQHVQESKRSWIKSLIQCTSTYEKNEIMQHITWGPYFIRPANKI